MAARNILREDATGQCLTRLGCQIEHGDLVTAVRHVVDREQEPFPSRQQRWHVVRDLAGKRIDLRQLFSVTSGFWDPDKCSIEIPEIHPAVPAPVERRRC